MAESSGSASGSAQPPPLRLRVRAAPPLPTTPFLLPLPARADYAELEHLVRSGLAAHAEPSEDGILLPAPDRDLVLEQGGFRILPVYRPAESLRDGDIIDVSIAVKKEHVKPGSAKVQAPVKAAESSDESSSSSSDDSDSDSSDSDEDEDASQESSSAEASSSSASSSSDDEDEDDEDEDDDDDEEEEQEEDDDGLSSSSEPLLVPVATRKLDRSAQPASAPAPAPSQPQVYVPPGEGSARTARKNEQKKRKRPEREQRAREEALRMRLETGTWDFDPHPRGSLPRSVLPAPPSRSQGIKSTAATAAIGAGVCALPPGFGSLGFDDEQVAQRTLPPALPGPLALLQQPALPLGAPMSALDALAAFDQAKRKRLIQDLDEQPQALSESQSSGTANRAGASQSGERKRKQSGAKARGSAEEEHRPISNRAFLERQGFIPPSERPLSAIPNGMVVTRVDCDVWRHEHEEALALAAEEELHEVGGEQEELQPGPVGELHADASQAELGLAGEEEDPEEEDQEDGTMLREEAEDTQDVSQRIRALAQMRIPSSDSDIDEGEDGRKGVPLQMVRNAGHAASASASALSAAPTKPSNKALVDLNGDDQHSSESSGVEFVSQSLAPQRTKKKNDVARAAPAPPSAAGSAAVPPPGGATAAALSLAGSAASLVGSPSSSLAQLAALRAKALMSKGSKSSPHAHVAARGLPRKPVAAGPAEGGIGGQESEPPYMANGMASFAGKVTKIGSRIPAGAKLPRKPGKQTKTPLIKTNGGQLPIDLDRIPTAQASDLLDYGGASDSDSD